MNPKLRNILSILAAIILGSFVNMGIITLGGRLIPPPDGADLTTMEGLRASIHLLQPKHFMIPLFAHALGTFASGLAVSFLAASHKREFALGVAAFFLLGGVMNSFTLPAPVWFIVSDLTLAYLPMGVLAERLVARRSA
ncbi:hypothetical protein EHO60_13135 [Leptospira fletcheri]|uniref:Uncharacterized protein n=1 Tax=Leptospira fletcheri TaxID=2484981 RepID=A0A4R9GD50_9LEPT|nr:hypothetical protein [Leptospira fletcheri]TGK08967.1 hypothetical protein EHO60_13135 [Leptospira fletcheri]